MTAGTDGTRESHISRFLRLIKNNTYMKIPPIKEDESLAMWRERLTREFNLSEQMKEILREVSVTSYIHGTNDMLEAMKSKND